MKKYSIYLGTLAIGLLLGWLLFGTSTTSDVHKHTLNETKNELWTCSMHPQIMQSETGDCPICGMDLIPFENSSEGLHPNQFKMTSNAIALANIETSIVGEFEEAVNINKLTLSGKIAINDKGNTVQTAHFSGRIEKLYYKSNGEHVKNGTLLASIYSPELVTAQNELIEALKIKKEQPELYKAVRNKLKLWKVSEKQIQFIEQNQKVEPNFNIYANTSGYIHEIFVEEGSHVKEGTPLFKVSNLETVWAVFDVYENSIRNIKIGQSINLKLNAFPKKKIKAVIDYINPTLNSATRTVSVRATLLNKNNTLKPGMLITSAVELQSNTNKQVLITIPKTAVLWTGKRSIVYVKNEGEQPIFEIRKVELGNDLGADYEIITGLNNGEEIVTNGTFTVDAAAQLQGKKSMMNTTGRKVLTGHENHIEMQKTKSKNETLKIERIKVAVKFQEQLKSVFTSYLLLKNNLVNDDSHSAQKMAKDLVNALQKVDMKLLTDTKSHNLWMAFLNEMNTSTKNISATNNIKNQRAQFILLSTSMEEIIATFGINQKVYHQFCPMANNDKGAFWLSTEEEILNPYFGASMLNCGTVEAVLE